MKKKSVNKKVKDISKIMKDEGFNLSRKEKKEIYNYLNNDIVNMINDIKKKNFYSFH